MINASAVSSRFQNKIEYVQRFATKEAADAAADGQGNTEEEEDAEMSDIGSISDDDDQAMDE